MFNVDYENRGPPASMGEPGKFQNIRKRGSRNNCYYEGGGVICFWRRGGPSTSFICFYFASKTN